MEYNTKYQSIVLMGKIASGKGTQARAVLDNFGGSMFSIGNKVRESAKLNTNFGMRIKEMYEQGLLMPEWLASYWMMHALLSQYTDDRVIFEAVARKENEAKEFAEIHEWLGREYVVFNLEISDDIVRERSRERSRDVVDTAEAVEKRLEEYEHHTSKSLAVFRDKGRLIDIDGTLSIDDVTKEIFTHLTAS